MPRARPIEQLLLRSRRILALAILLALVVLGVVVILATLQLRRGIREQIAGRDGEVLYAVALMNYAEDAAEGLVGPITDPGNQLNVVLRSAELRGVLGVRLFDPAGRFLQGFPVSVTERTLRPKLLSRVQGFRPACEFHPALPVSDLFLPETGFPGTGTVAVLEVNVPLHLPEQPLAGIAQFLLEGTSITAEYSRLDRHLAVQAGIALLVGGSLLSAGLGWSLLRLRRAHLLVQERTATLVKANRELALAARTSALGAVTAHLMHGLKSPLAGVQNFVASRAAAPESASEADWEQALVSTRRMQTIINQVAGVVREEESGVKYEITGPELIEAVRQRIDPLLKKKGVRFEGTAQVGAAFPNRVANLLALILVNLVENAVEATAQGKIVRLVLRPAAPRACLCEIEDQGPGFPESVPLFMPCTSSKEGGTGIGLALCKQLANHIGADLSLVRSGPEGCLFAVKVPASAVRVAEAQLVGNA